MRTAYLLYQVTFIRHNSNEMTIEAISRKGFVYIAHLKRKNDGYWEGGSDFGFSERVKFKGIIMEFLANLVQESKTYDNRWYSLHCVVRVEVNGNRPLTWEETYYGGWVNEDEPKFKGGVKFLTNRY